MKYEIGDKVKIRTWEDMKNEFGFLDVFCEILSSIPRFSLIMEKSLPKDRILTIKSVSGFGYYGMEENDYHWSDDMILTKMIIKKNTEDIVTRFELLDFKE